MSATQTTTNTATLALAAIALITAGTALIRARRQ